MNIYNDYIKNIELAMNADRRNASNESFDSFNGTIEKGFSSEKINKGLTSESLLPSLETFASELNLTGNFSQSLGEHPDFAYLKGTDKTEKHYIASAFIDIKGSTNLFRKYSPDLVLVINDTIQKAAIHTCIIFGGYIQRLQGDGLMVYYGGRNITTSDAVNQALLSTGIFSYFVKNDLRRVFDQQGIDNIYTRTGIDLGYNQDVVWSDTGIGRISEITTCSLHTSLAAKMQSYAVSNGIVIGANIVSEAPKIQELTTPISHRTENENDRYIFQIPDKNFRYTQFDFDWLKFLKKQDFIATDLEGRLTFKASGNMVDRSTDDLKSVAFNSTPYYDEK